MKTFKYTLFTLALVLGINVAALSQARVQVIHNSADLAAKSVDIWLNDVLLLDDFQFRTASPFVDIPEDGIYTISVQPENSVSSENALWSETFEFGKGKTYILIASGIVSPQGYEPAIPFNIYVYDMAREEAGSMGTVDVLAFHGSTDAPAVDVVEVSVPAGTLIDNFMYSQYAGYLELPVADFSLQLRDETGTNAIKEYLAPLASLGLEGQALTLVASGFLNTGNNSNGQPFGLFAALSSGGDLIPLPEVMVSTARAQFIHNAADVNAQIVDIYVNGNLFLDDFAFRTSTPFIDVPANQYLSITVHDAYSTNGENALWGTELAFEGGNRYVVIANGIVVPEGYSQVEPFSIITYPGARETGSSAIATDMLIFHGVTDAPAIDITETMSGVQFVDNLAYGQFAGYYTVPLGDYLLNVTSAGGADQVGMFEAPFETYNAGGEAITVLASGFLNPENNNNGAGFGLYISLASGGNLIALPEYVNQPPMEFARVQVIHNSADLAAAEVDVWLNDQLLIDNFAFRTATPFVDAPAGIDFDISIQPAGSTDTTDALARFTYNLQPGMAYLLVANGIVIPNGYNPVQPFDLYVYPDAREMAMNAGNTDVIVFHGSTDAPTVDVVETGAGAGTIIDNMMYGEFRGYLELPTDDYILEIRDENQTVTVATYAAPLASLGLNGQSITVLASGFLNPEVNNNGPAFGLYVALASGGALIPLGIITSVEENGLIEESVSAYPNPATDVIAVNAELTAASDIHAELYDMLGKKVKHVELGYGRVINNSRIDVGNLSEGLYMLRINAGETSVTRKIKIIR